MSACRYITRETQADVTRLLVFLSNGEAHPMIYSALASCVMLDAHQAGQEHSPHHEFLEQLRADTLYSTLVWEGVSALESAKDYVVALCALRKLLSGHHAQHRRGAQYHRLCVDLDHMGLFCQVRPLVIRSVAQTFRTL
jgi:hypothetical protein